MVTHAGTSDGDVAGLSYYSLSISKLWFFTLYLTHSHDIGSTTETQHSKFGGEVLIFAHEIFIIQIRRT